MINWWWVVSNTLWISGLALLLAAWSYRRCRVSRRGAPGRSEMVRLNLGDFFRLGLLLFCVGLFATSGSWWEKILWGSLALVILLKPAAIFGRPSPEKEDDIAEGPGP